MPRSADIGETAPSLETSSEIDVELPPLEEKAPSSSLEKAREGLNDAKSGLKDLGWPEEAISKMGSADIERILGDGERFPENIKAVSEEEHAKAQAELQANIAQEDREHLQRRLREELDTAADLEEDDKKMFSDLIEQNPDSIQFALAGQKGKTLFASKEGRGRIIDELTAPSTEKLETLPQPSNTVEAPTITNITFINQETGEPEAQENVPTEENQEISPEERREIEQEEAERYKEVPDEKLKSEGQKVKGKFITEYTEKRSSRGEGVEGFPEKKEEVPVGGEIPEAFAKEAGRSSEDLVNWLNSEIAILEVQVEKMGDPEAMPSWARVGYDEVLAKLRILRIDRDIYMHSRESGNLNRELEANMRIFDLMDAEMESQARSRGIWSFMSKMLEAFRKLPWVEQVANAVSAVGSSISMPFKSMADAMKNNWNALVGNTVAPLYDYSGLGSFAPKQLDPVTVQQYKGVFVESEAVPTPGELESVSRSFTGAGDLSDNQREATWLASINRAERAGVSFDIEVEEPTTAWHVLWQVYEPMMQTKGGRTLKYFEKEYMLAYMIEQLEQLDGAEQLRLFGIEGENLNLISVAITKGTKLSLKEFHKTGFWYAAKRSLDQLIPQQLSELMTKHENGEIAKADSAKAAKDNYISEPQESQVPTMNAEDIASTKPSGFGRLLFNSA